MLLEDELMKIILVKTGTFPCIMNVPHELTSLQALVGGNIEVVEPFDDGNRSIIPCPDRFL